MCINHAPHRKGSSYKALAGRERLTSAQNSRSGLYTDEPNNPHPGAAYGVPGSGEGL